MDSVPSPRQIADCSHDLIEELFASMVRAAHGGAWPRCDEIGRDFLAALDDHLRREERAQFPRYATTSAGAAAEVEAFLVEHERIRQAAARIFVELRNRQLDLENVGGFEILLRDHGEREALRFGPWLERFGRGLAGEDSA